MNLISFMTIFFHLFLPIIFLLWVGMNKGKSKLSRLLVGLLVTGYLITMYIGGAAWYWIGSYWPALFIALLGPALFFLIKKSRGLPWMPEQKFKPISQILILLIFSFLFLSGIPELVTARSYEGRILELNFPLGEGTYHIVHGGKGAGINHHYPISAQKHALDIVKVNSMGMRASGIVPASLDDFEIFGEKILAPCGGEIIGSKDGLEDHFPAKPDPKNLAGNYVILECNGQSILLAHMKKDSVKVKKGDWVNMHGILGKVGNSGNTTEPHLHIHAVKGQAITDMLVLAGSGEGVPLIFGDKENKFLIRNDKVVIKREK